MNGKINKKGNLITANKYRRKITQKYLFMSHFINQSMPPTVLNILLGAFIFVKSYIYCFNLCAPGLDRLIMHLDNRITCKNIQNQTHLYPFMN